MDSPLTRTVSVYCLKVDTVTPVASTPKAPVQQYVYIIGSTRSTAQLRRAVQCNDELCVLLLQIVIIRQQQTRMPKAVEACAGTEWFLELV